MQHEPKTDTEGWIAFGSGLGIFLAMVMINTPALERVMDVLMGGLFTVIILFWIIIKYVTRRDRKRGYCSLRTKPVNLIHYLLSSANEDHP